MLFEENLIDLLGFTYIINNYPSNTIVEQYYSEIRNIGLLTDEVWDRKLDNTKRPIVEAINDLISTGIKFTSSSGGCIPCSRILLENLLPKIPSLEQIPFGARPHAFLYAREYRLIVDPTYLQHFDVGQYEMLLPHNQYSQRAPLNNTRVKEISQSVGSVLVATRNEIGRLFIANHQKIAISGILRDWHRTPEESKFIAGRYGV